MAFSPFLTTAVLKIKGLNWQLGKGHAKGKQETHRQRGPANFWGWGLNVSLPGNHFPWTDPFFSYLLQKPPTPYFAGFLTLTSLFFFFSK